MPFMASFSFIVRFPSLVWINSDGWQNGLRYHSGSLRAFQPATCRISVFCIWRKRPPDLLCRRQLKTHSGKIAGCSGCRARSLGVTVVEPIFQPSEYISCFLVGGASGGNISRTRAPKVKAASLLVCGRRRFRRRPLSLQLSKIKTPKGLGRATNSVSLCAGRNMSPHVLKRGFSIPILGKNDRTAVAYIVHVPFFIGSKRISKIFSM